MSDGDRAMGHDSHLCDPSREETWVHALAGADVHVAHTDFPVAVRKVYPNAPVVFVGHGTPEVMMMEALDASNVPGYAPADGWMLLRHWIRNAHAVVTFWPRHRDIYQRILGRQGIVDAVPMGVETEFWKGGEFPGKYLGEPSVWTSENAHRIKWAFDFIAAWPQVIESLPFAKLHAHYMALPVHRFMIDFANSNGAAIGAILSAATWDHRVLRNIWKGFDFFLGLVRYGDHNQLSLQAAATGMKTISYRGNEYADYWVTEGDHRVMAQELVAIFKKDVEPRANKLPVPDVKDTGVAMNAVYERLLTKGHSMVGNIRVEMPTPTPAMVPPPPAGGNLVQ